MKHKVLDRLRQVCVVLIIHHLYFDTLYTCVGVHVCVNKCIQRGEEDEEERRVRE